jgi:hypothetical protein
MGVIHGVGFLTRSGKREEVLAHHNVVHCFRSGDGASSPS